MAHCNPSQSSWRRIILCCLSLALACSGNRANCQEAWESDSEDSLPKPIGAQLEPVELPESEDGEEIVPAGFADLPAPSGGDGLFDAISKRLADVEKQLKKRDEADAKKANEFPTFKITGFLQLDSANYSQQPLNIATVGRAQNGTGFRRARLAVNGKVAEFTNYQLEVDFASAGRPSFFDNYVEQGNIPFFGSVRVGQFCQPFSVDALTGFRNLTFLERSLPFLAMVPFRRVGASSNNVSEDGRTALTYSFFRTGGFNEAPLGDDRFATDFGNIGGFSFSTRATHLLWYEEDSDDRYLWHIGGSYNYSRLTANNSLGAGVGTNSGTPQPFYQAKTTPEFGPLGYPDLGSSFGPTGGVNGTPNFVDTGRYLANSFNLFGLETVYQNGPWGATAEYMATVVDSAVGPITYQGASGFIAYRLTGENRVYDKKSGTLGKLVPFADFIPLGSDGVKGWGAWEVAGRYSIIDLRNPDDLSGKYYDSATNTFTASAAKGAQGNGVLQDTTLGVTWFLNTHTKVQFNWIHAMLDNKYKGFSTADLFVSRVQVDF